MRRACPAWGCRLHLLCDTCPVSPRAAVGYWQCCRHPPPFGLVPVLVVWVTRCVGGCLCGNKHEQAKRRNLNCPPSSLPSLERRGGQLCADKVPAHSPFRFGRSWCRVVLPGALRSSWTPRFAGPQRAMTQEGAPRLGGRVAGSGSTLTAPRGPMIYLTPPPPEPEP